MSGMNFMEKLLDGVEVEWKTLGQTCKIETGKLNANAAVDDGEYMFFTTAKETSKIDKFRWDTEALLIAGNANVGEVKHYIGKFEAYQRTYVLTNFDENVSVRFLYFVLSHSLKKYLEERTNSAAMTYIVLSTLENFPIPIPRASALGHHMGSSPSTRTRSSSDHAVALRFMRKLILPFFPIGTGRTKFSTIFFNNDRFCGA